MAKQFELNKQKGKATGQWENRPVWNNVQRMNHQNKFVPKAVLTKTGIFPVNTARQNLSSQAATTSIARKINIARPIVNKIRPRSNFYRSHSPIRKPSNRTTTPKVNFANNKVNTIGDKTISAIGGNRETAVDPQKALKNKGIFDSGCSRHMTENNAYLVEYQDYNGGSSKGQITGKELLKTELVLFDTKMSRMQKTDSDLEEEEHLKTFPKLVLVIENNRLSKYWRRKDDIWKNQEEWILRSWNFYENCGVHTLILEDGTEIHMLAERKYPLTKETLERMLSLKLIAESASESAYNLLRFIQKQIDEYGSYDGREKDL
ncbi:hypothetical protein Tco_0556840 [Tanacetum coccineum]